MPRPHRTHELTLDSAMTLPHDPPKRLRGGSHARRGKTPCGTCGRTDYRDFGYIGETLTCAGCVFKRAEQKRDAETPQAPTKLSTTRKL